MGFIDIRFPVDVSYGAEGGATYSTDIISFSNGKEQRQSNRYESLQQYKVGHNVKKKEQLDALIAFFRIVKGSAYSFRFKDWMDYQCTSGGVFNTIDATHFQMVKKYANGANEDRRIINKPVSGTVVITGGTVASVDYNTGIVTMSSGTPTTWTGEFDVCCRFGSDTMSASINDYGIYGWESIELNEVFE